MHEAEKILPVTTIESGVGIEVLPDIFCYTVQIVNIYLVGNPNSTDFVLVDAGMPGSANEIVYKVLTQEQEISGSPRYFTPDWKAAKESVVKLEALKPSVAVTGHGLPMSGEILSSNLESRSGSSRQLDCFGRKIGRAEPLCPYVGQTSPGLLEADRNELPAYTEVCSHYLALTGEKYGQPDGQNHFAVPRSVLRRNKTDLQFFLEVLYLMKQVSGMRFLLN